MWTFCWTRSSRCCRRPASSPSATLSFAANPASGPGKGRPGEPLQWGPPTPQCLPPDPSPWPEWGARSTRDPPHARTVTWTWPTRLWGLYLAPWNPTGQPAPPVSGGQSLAPHHQSGLGLSTWVPDGGARLSSDGLGATLWVSAAPEAVLSAVNACAWKSPLSHPTVFGWRWFCLVVTVGCCPWYAHI